MPRVVTFDQTGDPDVLKIEQVAPPAPGPGEVRIAVEAIGLNRAEALFRAGKYVEAPRLPGRIGYEAAGVVEAVGSGVDGVLAGDPVAVIPTFSMNDYATYGESVLVPARAVVKRPAGMSASDGAALWMAYLTAYGGLVDAGALSRGDSVLITAAASSVGLAAIRIARRIGAVPIAMTRSGSKRNALLAAGAQDVIVAGDDDVIAGTREATSGCGVNLVFDAIAGPGVDLLMQSLAPRGVIVLYGNLSREGHQTPFPFRLAMSRGLGARGFTVFELTRDASRVAKSIAFILDGYASGDFRPHIDRTFRLGEIVEAHRYLESGRQTGKIVVIP